jgi:tetratricopeptide (TPR) repeat protein
MVLAGLVGTPLLLAALLLSWRWTRAALVGWLIFFVAVFPTLGVIGFTYVIAADKFAYWPAIGLLLPLVALLARLGTGSAQALKRRIRQSTVVAVLVVLVAAEFRLTRRYLSHWQNTEGLHRYALSQFPGAYAIRHNLGELLREQGRLDEAASEFERVLRQRPDHWRAHSALGLVLHSQQRDDEAIAQLNEAIRLNQDEFAAQYNLGVILAERGRTEEAIAHYREALRIRPEYYRAYTNLGNALATLGRNEEALAQYDEALRRNPTYARGHFNRGVVLSKMGRTDEALAEYRRALEIDPNHAGARQQLEGLTSQPAR